MAISHQLCTIPRFISFLSSPITKSPLRTPSKLLLKSDFLARSVSTTPLYREDKDISITFIYDDGDKRTGKGKVGDSLYDVMINNGIKFEDYDKSEIVNDYCPVCALCHMIFTKEDYENLPVKPMENELYILDLAFFKTETSRLGCVIKLTESMNGLVVRVPCFIPPHYTWTSCGTEILADFMLFKRDSCRYKCLNAHEPVERVVGKISKYLIANLFLVILASFR